jgi:hypothetical protein
VIQGDHVGIIAFSGSDPGVLSGEPAWLCSEDFVRGWRGPRKVGSAILNAIARGLLRACVFFFFLLDFAFAIRASFHESVGELQHEPPL